MKKMIKCLSLVVIGIGIGYVINDIKQFLEEDDDFTDEIDKETAFNDNFYDCSCGKKHKCSDCDCFEDEL